MNQAKTKGSFESLEKTVIQTGRCSGCGSCTIACAKGILSYDNQGPSLIEECQNCGLCLRACPRYESQELQLDQFVYQSSVDKEANPWGNCQQIVVARSTDPEIRERGQDSGVVSSLLVWALAQGVAQGAVVSGLSAERPCLPQPVVATNREEVLAASGSRYTYSPNLLALKQAVQSGLSSVAFVGTPCQISAYRQLQKGGLRKMAGPVVAAIGLFCSKTFSYEGLIEGKIAGEMEVDLNEVVGFQIKGKLQVHLRSGEMKEIPLKEAGKYARPGCAHCGDFTAEFADISVGAIGADGWNVVIIRSDTGAKLFNQAREAGRLEARPWTDFPASREILTKLALLQRRRVTSEG